MKVVQAFTSFTHQSLLIAFIYPSVHFYCGWRSDLNLVLLGVLRQQHILVCNRVLNKADNDNEAGRRASSVISELNIWASCLSKLSHTLYLTCLLSVEPLILNVWLSCSLSQIHFSHINRCILPLNGREDVISSVCLFVCLLALYCPQDFTFLCDGRYQ